MENLKVKLKEVYLPFLIVSLGTIFFYNLFRWYFDIKLNVLPLKENLLNFWIPCYLPWIPILIWLRRRIRILNVGGKWDNGHFFYQSVIAATIAIPTIISQNYIEKASFDLVSVNSMAEMGNYNKEKYFDVRSFSIDKKAILPYVTTRKLDENNNNINIYLYLACPFEQSNKVWYGLEYRKTFSNRISDAEYNKFLEKKEREFNIYNFQDVKYFEKLGYSDDRSGFLEAIKEAKPGVNEKEQIILVPKKEDFEQRLGNTFFWIFGSFGIGAIILLIMIIVAKIDEGEWSDFKKGNPSKDDNLKDILEYIDPRGPNKITAVLILSNVIVFCIVMLLGVNAFSPTTKELLEVGGNRRSEVMSGEYWRLFTSMFIHGGLTHLFMNLLGLGLGGSLLEGILGRTKLILSFFASGILGSLASISWYENTVSVGASGAIFGLYGLILAFTIFKIYPNHIRGMAWGLLSLYVGVSLLFGFLGEVDNAAHFGGLTAGFIIGVTLILVEKEKLIKSVNK